MMRKNIGKIINGAVNDALEEYFSAYEDAPDCEKCSDVEQLEAVTVAMIKSLRERIDKQDREIEALKGRIASLEGGPVPGNINSSAGFDHLLRPWQIIYGY